MCVPQKPGARCSFIYMVQVKTVQELRCGLPSTDGRLPLIHGPTTNALMEKLLYVVTGRMFHALTVLEMKDCLWCSVLEWGM